MGSAHQSCSTATNSDPAQPGGGVPQSPGPGNQGAPPPVLRELMLEADCDGYCEQAFRDGIPFRPRGLFPPGDPLLHRLAADLHLHAFEKKMTGIAEPTEQLPLGGWATGDAAAARGLDLRLFYQEPEVGEQYSAIRGAVRFGDGAAIGDGFWTSAHGGAIETVLDEATAELAKCCFSPLVSTREASFAILKPVPLHTSLAVTARIKEVRGIRCYVEGVLRAVPAVPAAPGGAAAGGSGAAAEEGAVLATGTFLLINMRDFVEAGP